MKFKIDENLPIELAEYLKSQGNDAHTVYDEGIAGAKDEVIGRKCKDEERILITLDQDFSDIRAYPPEFYWIHAHSLGKRYTSLECEMRAGYLE